ncbi:MAG: T9SS type A sorting domain-containing protein [Saprospiraceae bacterium]|nr:T9SS type A sorting domain-containing protein [Saprospiraceae bacterium]
MKIFYCTLFCFMVSKMVSAQITKFEALENPCKIEFITDPNVFEHVCYNKVANRHTRSIELLWERIDVSLTEGWEAYVCDNLNCYPSFVTRCPEENYNAVEPNALMNLDVHVADHEIEGSAHVEVYVFERQDTTQKLKVDYLFNKSLSTKGPARTQLIRMYPNPTQNSFTVDFNYGLSRIEIYNIMGKKLLGFNAIQGKSYDISMLTDGIYMVRLVGQNQQVVKTLKLYKRSERP